MSEVEIDWTSRQRGVSDEANEGTFELSNVGFDARSDENSDVVGYEDLLEVGLFAKNGDFGFEIRSLNIRGQTPFETRSETFLESWYLSWRRITAYNDLFLRIIKSVESMKELFLRALLACDELNIVHKKDVDGTMLSANFLHMHCVSRLV